MIRAKTLRQRAFDISIAPSQFRFRDQGVMFGAVAMKLGVVVVKPPESALSAINAPLESRVV
jgi:hypothetical protein